MKLLIPMVIIILCLFSCSNITTNIEITAVDSSPLTTTDDSNLATETSGMCDYDYTAYDVFIENNDNIYKPDDINYFQIMKSNTADIIYNKNYDRINIVCIKDNSGNIYAALSGSENSDSYNCFYTIGDSEYPYSDTIDISEYNGVMGHSGFILSFGTGADNKRILYFYLKDDKPVLLAECNKSNYETDYDDKGNRKLITTFGSVISETVVYYNINDQIYRFDFNYFVYNLFCTDNERVSVTYNDNDDNFIINIFSKDNFTIVSSKQAYINDDILYIK